MRLQHLGRTFRRLPLRQARVFSRVLADLKPIRMLRMDLLQGYVVLLQRSHLLHHFSVTEKPNCFPLSDLSEVRR